MNIRSIIIKATLLFVVIGAMAALLAYNSPDTERKETASKVDYRTYCYGQNADATNSYYKLLSLYRNGQRSEYICASLELCGNSLYLNGHYAKAFDAYIMAMEMAEDTGNTRSMAICYYNIGNIFVIFKDYEMAADYYEKVLAQPEDKNHKSTKCLAARYLVMCYAKTGKKDKARQTLKRAEQMPLSDRHINEYYRLYCTALVADMDGKHDVALDMQKQAYAITRKHGMKIGMGAYPLSEQASILAAAGRYTEAADIQRTAMHIARSEKAYNQLDDACVALDSLFRKLNLPDSAAVYLNMHRDLTAEKLSAADFYSARNKLKAYEDGMNTRKINLLKRKVNMMLAGILMVTIVLAVILFYSQKLRKAYRMLALKNRQLISEQDENQKLLAEKNAEGATCQGNDPADETATPGNEDRKHLADDMLVKKIMEIMNDTETICNTEFSLQTLARLAGSNTKYVSAAISSTAYGSFKSMLNEYRTREACRRLADEKYQAYTIQAVAETVGYVSVNNFIIQFKKYTGMTPSVYRKNAMEARS